MKSKYAIAAAALLVSTGASAQAVEARHAGVAARHVVLDNIIGRVQVDALIGTIVATDRAVPVNVAANAARPVRLHRAVAYAAAGSATVRSRG